MTRRPPGLLEFAGGAALLGAAHEDAQQLWSCCTLRLAVHTCKQHHWLRPAPHDEHNPCQWLQLVLSCSAEHASMSMSKHELGCRAHRTVGLKAASEAQLPQAVALLDQAVLLQACQHIPAAAPAHQPETCTQLPQAGLMSQARGDKAVRQPARRDPLGRCAQVGTDAVRPRTRWRRQRCCRTCGGWPWRPPAASRSG